MSFCSLTKGITPKIRMLCFIIITIVFFTAFDVFGSNSKFVGDIFHDYGDVFHDKIYLTKLLAKCDPHKT